MNRCRMVFSGSGGQGVILASIIYAEAAVLYEAKEAVQSQSYGPEARGGASRADVIISDTIIRFPKVIAPNVLVCLSQESYNKYSHSIRPSGILLTDTHYVRTHPKAEARQIELPMHDAVMEKIKKILVLNMCMLGAVTSLVGIVSPASIKKSLEKNIPQEALAGNLQAFELGMRLAAPYGVLWQNEE